MSETIHICTGSNERFMIGATAAFSGIALNAKPETELHFHIFTEDVTRESIAFMESALKRLHTNTVLHEHICDEKLLAGLPYWAGSRLSAARVFYPYLLPEVDWCLYVDCDLLYFSSPEEHFAYRGGDVYACVTQEEHAETRDIECAWARKQCGVEIPDSEYFNAGVMLFNFKKCREDKIPDKIQQFYKDHPDVRLPDQTAMNVLFNGKKKMLPAKYDRLGLLINDAKLAERPVLHFVGGNPWSTKFGVVETSRMRLWHAYCDKYIWQKEGESYRRFFTKKQILLKRWLFWALGCPILGSGVAYFFQLIGKSQDGIAWRKQQLGGKCSQSAVRTLLGE